MFPEVAHFFWKQFSPLTRLDSRFSNFLNLLVEVTFRPLLRFLTISGAQDSVSSEAGLFGKLKHGATSPIKGGEPSSAPKTLKITHQ